MSSKISTSVPSTKWLEQVGSAIALLDSNFNFVAASDQWYALFDLERQHASHTQKSIFSLFPSITDDFETRLEYALDGLKDIQLICKAGQLDGCSKDNIWYLNPWKDGYGTTIGVVINVKEVSERRNLELNLHKTKHLLEQKSDIANIGTWEYDVENDMLIWSDKVKEIHGLSNHYDPMFEITLDFFKEGASYMTMRRAFDDAVINAKPWNEIVQIVTLDGKEKWVNSIGRPKFKDGKCTRILGTLQEVEKNKIKESFYGENQLLDFKKVFENAPNAMAICDYRTGDILETNNALLSDFHLDAAELKNKSFASYLSLMRTERLHLARKLLSTHQFGPFQTSFVKKLTSGSVVEISGSLLNGKNSRKLVLVQIKRQDSLNGLQVDSQLTDIDEEFKKLIHFNHMISHNLKNHATNISLLLGFVDKESNKVERDNMMRLLNQSTDHLMSEIKILREMVAIGENKGLKKVSLPLNDFILSAEQKLSGQIRKENAKIFNGVEEELSVSVVPVYMESVLNNILSNALRFRQEDKNPVIVFNAQEEDDYIVLSIEDNGVGIDLDQYKDKIFALYQTINNTDSSGIGLYLAKYQMELMQGRIKVDSTVGLGTTFKLFLPKT